MKRNEINNIWMKAIEKKEFTLEEKAMIQIAYIESEIMTAALDKDNSYCVTLTKTYQETCGIIDNHFRNNGFDVEFVERFTPEDYDFLLIEWN